MMMMEMMMEMTMMRTLFTHDRMHVHATPRRNDGGHLASVRDAEEEDQMEELVRSRWSSFFLTFSNHKGEHH